MRSNPLEGVDYRVACDDFMLYELARLIDEERASFEDDDFRRVIEAGMHEHIERRLDVRAAMAKRLRSSDVRPEKLLRAIEDIESRLLELPEIIQSYTAYLFEKLEQCAAVEPDERITSAADRLLEAPEDRAAAEAALDLLGNIRSPVSARVLAHVVSEPMLEEDLEKKAFGYLREMWPLPRHYILYSLKPHTHEDIPFRWFQLLIDREEPSAVDRILEEVMAHGGDSDYREDLLALVALLEQARDPETEDKILQVLNSEDTPQPVVGLLQDFLKNTKAQRPKDTNGPWSSLDRAYAANRRYVEAARLWDSGKKSEAAQILDQLLQEEPQYPFALMLKELI
jgi:hypothetical protein